MHMADDEGATASSSDIDKVDEVVGRVQIPSNQYGHSAAVSQGIYQAVLIFLSQDEINVLNYPLNASI